MRKHVASILAIVTSRVIAVTALTTLQTVVVLAADNCVTEPNLQMTKGGHWYYYVDRVKNRKCWFLWKQDVQGSSAGSQQAQSSSLPMPQPTSPSWSSYLTLAFAPASEPGPQRPPPQSDARTTQSSTTYALRRDAVLPKEQPQIARHPDSDGKPLPKMRQPSNSRSSEKRSDQRNTASDQVSNDALFQEFLLWQARQSTLDPLDETGRDVLFREFLLWQLRQRSAEP
jgi:hypothetical protein